MKDTLLEDYLTEIKALQVADYEKALENNFKTKKDWYNFIINQEVDEIANCIISISNRYNIPLERVAKDFDSSMIMRVGKIIQNNTKIRK
ncbi:MAG: hypothetical protein PHH51_02755 [Bacilli bacterium]|nr:hypothetical protein [Bacilli bacterium]MDD3895557.1 hypothetical protein [Bacilli bacterium]MDD4407540.1 hypothetical protein [Bacilli bacterium]